MTQKMKIMPKDLVRLIAEEAAVSGGIAKCSLEGRENGDNEGARGVWIRRLASEWEVEFKEGYPIPKGHEDLIPVPQEALTVLEGYSEKGLPAVNSWASMELYFLAYRMLWDQLVLTHKECLAISGEKRLGGVMEATGWFGVPVRLYRQNRQLVHQQRDFLQDLLGCLFGMDGKELTEKEFREMCDLPEFPQNKREEGQ